MALLEGLNLFAKDPFFIGALVFVFVHFVSYYILLDKINVKIKKKKKESLGGIRREFSDGLKKRTVFFKFHNAIHDSNAKYKKLSDKIFEVYRSAIFIFILLLLISAKSIFTLSDDFILALLLILSLVSIGFFIGWFSLLHWNLKN